MFGPITLMLKVELLMFT